MILSKFITRRDPSEIRDLGINLNDFAPAREPRDSLFSGIAKAVRRATPVQPMGIMDTRIIPEEYGLEPRDYGESELMESDTTTREGILSKFNPMDLLSFLTNFYTGGTKQALAEAGIGKAFGNIRDAIGNRLGPSPYGTSQAAFNAMTPSQQQAVGSIYGPGGIMQGYNAVSAFGRGPAGAIQNRIDNILGRKAAQTAISRQRVKDLQTALTNVGGGGGSDDYGPSGYEGMSDAASDQERSEGGRGSRG